PSLATGSARPLEPPQGDRIRRPFQGDSCGPIRPDVELDHRQVVLTDAASQAFPAAFERRLVANPETEKLRLELRRWERPKPLGLVVAEDALGDRNGVAHPAGQLDIHPDRVLEGEGEQPERTRVGDVELDSLSRDRARLAPLPLIELHRRRVAAKVLAEQLAQDGTTAAPALAAAVGAE